MLEKIIPVIIALFAIQLLIRFLNNRKKNSKPSSRNLDYKKRIDEFLKISSYDEGVNRERVLTDEIRSGLGKPELILNIPDNMRDVRRNLNLVIDAVTQGVKSKTGSLPEHEKKYSSPDRMFDEIIEVINRHRIP